MAFGSLVIAGDPHCAVVGSGSQAGVGSGLNGQWGS